MNAASNFLNMQRIQSTRAQSISSQEQVQHHNAKNSQHRAQQLPYFTSVNNNMTGNYSDSVLIGDLSPWRHLTACSPCHEVEHTVAWQYIRMNSACHVPRPVWTSRLRLLSAVVPSVRLAYRCSSLLCVRISIRFSRIQTKQSAPRQTRILWSRRCASFSAKLQWWTTAMRKASAKYVWGGAASACHLPPCVR